MMKRDARKRRKSQSNIYQKDPRGILSNQLAQ